MKIRAFEDLILLNLKNAIVLSLAKNKTAPSNTITKLSVVVRVCRSNATITIEVMMTPYGRKIILSGMMSHIMVEDRIVTLVNKMQKNRTIFDVDAIGLLSGRPFVKPAMQRMCAPKKNVVPSRNSFSSWKDSKMSPMTLSMRPALINLTVYPQNLNAKAMSINIGMGLMKYLRKCSSAYSMYSSMAEATKQAILNPIIINNQYVAQFISSAKAFSTSSIPTINSIDSYCKCRGTLMDRSIRLSLVLLTSHTVIKPQPFRVIIAFEIRACTAFSSGFISRSRIQDRRQDFPVALILWQIASKVFFSRSSMTGRNLLKTLSYILLWTIETISTVTLLSFFPVFFSFCKYLMDYCIMCKHFLTSGVNLATFLHVYVTASSSKTVRSFNLNFMISSIYALVYGLNTSRLWLIRDKILYSNRQGKSTVFEIVSNTILLFFSWIHQKMLQRMSWLLVSRKSTSSITMTLHQHSLT